jgi:hypothetical protein
MDDLFFSVKVEGEEVNDLLAFIEVEENDSRTDLATLTFGDSNLVLSDILHEGLTVEIDLGHRDAHTLIFRGIIVGIMANFPSRGQSIVEVQAADTLIRLSYEPKTLRWWNTTISQIIRDIAKANKFFPGDIEVEDDAVIKETRPLQQVEETDLAFLYRLAKDYDCKLYVEHSDDSDKLSFVSTKKLLEAKKIEETLTFNANVEDFTAYFDAFATAPEIQLVSTDLLSGESIEISDDLIAFGEEQWVPDPERIARLGEGAIRISKLLARTTTVRARLRDFWRRPPRRAGISSRSSSDRSQTFGDMARRFGLTGKGRAAGSIWLRPRRRVTIEGYGGRWSGEWYLTNVRHHLDIARRNYISFFVCTR